MKTNHRRTQPERHPSKKNKTETATQENHPNSTFFECPSSYFVGRVSQSFWPKKKCAKQTAPFKGAVCVGWINMLKRNCFFSWGRLFFTGLTTPHVQILGFARQDQHRFFQCCTTLGDGACAWLERGAHIPYQNLPQPPDTDSPSQAPEESRDFSPGTQGSKS